MLTPLQRRMLRYDGVPARDVAVLERITVARVLEVRTGLQLRGLLAARPGTEAAAHEHEQQLTFEEMDREMRGNRARGL